MKSKECVLVMRIYSVYNRPFVVSNQICNTWHQEGPLLRPHRGGGMILDFFKYPKETDDEVSAVG